MEDEILEKLIATLKIGLARVESSSAGGYQAINTTGKKPTYALGKYQFVPSIYWNQIKKYAKKEHGETFTNYQDFLNKPYIQEGFFEHYVKTNLYPAAKKLYDKYSDQGMSLDEIGAMVHFTGAGGTKKLFENGHYIPGDKQNKNLSTKRYLDVYKKGLAEGGAERVDNSVIVQEPKSRKEIWKNYNDEKDAIYYDKKLSDPVKQMKINELNRRQFMLGNFTIDKNGNPGGILNEEILKVNEKLKEDYEKELQSLRDLIQLTDDVDVLYYSTNKGQKISSFSTTAFNSDEAEKYNALAKKYPKLLRAKTNGNYEVNGKILVDQMKRNVKNLTGKDVDMDAVTRGKDLKIDVAAFSTAISKTFNAFGENNPYSGTLKVSDRVKNFLSQAKFDSDVHGMSLIRKDPEWNLDIQKKKVNIKKPHEDAVTIKEDAKNTLPEEDLTALNEFFSGTDQELQEQFEYRKEDFKNGFPLADIFTSGVGIATGLTEAAKKTPRRTEEVNDAFLNYTAELKKLSELGLTPQEEAYAKKNLSEAYHGSVDMLVKASNGNRNLVLGNLGALDARKNDSLLKLSMMDNEVRVQNLQKYGEAVKYINEFDARRDISNQEKDYREAFLSKEAGGQLAAKGFQSLMESIQYAKENGPGSANHMLKSFLLEKTTGIVPDMIDDGTGKKGTYSGLLKSREESQKAYDDRFGNKQDRDTWSNLSNDQRQVFSKFFKETNQNQETGKSFLNFLGENNVSQANFDYLPTTLKTGDYSTLFEDYVDKSNMNQNNFNFDQPQPKIPNGFDFNQGSDGDVNRYQQLIDNQNFI